MQSVIPNLTSYASNGDVGSAFANSSASASIEPQLVFQVIVTTAAATCGTVAPNSAPHFSDSPWIVPSCAKLQPGEVAATVVGVPTPSHAVWSNTTSPGASGWSGKV